MPKTPARGRKGAVAAPSATPVPPARPVPIATLVRHAGLQVRDGIDAGTVKSYRHVLANGGELPPVRVVDVEGVWYLADGWHRTAAAEHEGSGVVDAVVTPGTLDDARWLAASANLTHGLALTRKEKRRAFAVYIGTRRHRDGKRFKSYREIAGELPGVGSHTALRLWMHRDYPAVARAMAKAYPGDEPPTNAGASWPAPDPIEFAREGARDAAGQIVAILNGLPAEHGRELYREIRQTLARVAELRAGWDDESPASDADF